jgi:hypothetical protein
MFLNFPVDERIFPEVLGGFPKSGEDSSCCRYIIRKGIQGHWLTNVLTLVAHLSDVGLAVYLNCKTV